MLIKIENLCGVLVIDSHTQIHTHNYTFNCNLLPLVFHSRVCATKNLLVNKKQKKTSR